MLALCSQLGLLAFEGGEGLGARVGGGGEGSRIEDLLDEAEPFLLARSEEDEARGREMRLLRETERDEA